MIHRTFICIYILLNYVSALNNNIANTARRALGQRNEWQLGTEIELPNFEALFDRIKMVSPLAGLVMDGKSRGGAGFESIDDACHYPELRWEKIEENKRKTVHRIDKLDSFQNIKAPLLRFRSTIKGPCLGDRFSNFIMDLDERKKWDDQIDFQEEMYPIDDLESVNCMLGNENFGKCVRIGVGYVRTKQGIISPREQLILGGRQEFKDGSTILWGTEMEEYHNHLLPPGQRHARARSHLFAATLAPTGSNSFDVEYLLQMDVGGGLPYFITTPAITKIVKKLFDHTKEYFESEGGCKLNFILHSKEQANHQCSNDEMLHGIQPQAKSFPTTVDDESHHLTLSNSKSILFTT